MSEQILEVTNDETIVISDCSTEIVEVTGAQTEIIETAQVVNNITNIGGTTGGAPAAVTISGHMAVVMIAGQLYPADVTNPAHFGKVVGIAAQAASQPGTQINYVPLGELNGFAGFLTQDAPYFIGLDGILSTTTKAAGAAWYQYVGLAKDGNTLFVDLAPPIEIG